MIQVVIKIPYRKLIVNNTGKIETTLSQMEQWSIHSNIINCVLYDKLPKNFHNMSVRPINKMKNKIQSTKDEKERPISEIDFRDTSNRLKEEYLDRYEEVKSEILCTTRFNESSDLCITYLGRVNIVRGNKITAEKKFLISEQGYTTGKLLDSTKCQILLDTRASKSFMSKLHYLHCKSLHSLPKFASKTQRNQVGNGQYVIVLFVIPIIVDLNNHRFEVYTLVSEIHENVDLVLGIKNSFKLEGVINSWECCFSFLNRSIPLFPKEKIILKPKEQNVVKVEAPFIDEISGLATVKILVKLMQNTMMLKLKFTQNLVMSDIMNSSSEIVILNPKETRGVLDLRSLGFYKIQQGVLQQNLSKFYNFESSENVCNQFNNLINTLKREETIETGENIHG